MRVGLIVPHIFMHRDILPHVIFAPGRLAVHLAESLQSNGAEVTLFTPGPIDSSVKNVTADLTLFETELRGRGDGYTDLLKKHPFTFVTLARQVQSELIAKAFAMANDDLLDVVHIYTNEEDVALPFIQFCQKPVVLTHHDPFNFMVKYKSTFPKYSHLNWISLSFAQRKGMPPATNWVANIYHGINPELMSPVTSPSNDYFAYLGRVIEPKGVHLAIQAVQTFNRQNNANIPLLIAGKHYSGHKKDAYWQEVIKPILDSTVKFVGFIDNSKEKNQFLGNARALLVPSTFDEPFGMVAIEALACGTPVVALDSGALPELIDNGVTGWIATKCFGAGNQIDQKATSSSIADKLAQLDIIDREVCRRAFLDRFTIDRMCREHLSAYRNLTV